jgi:two-component system, NtrC family, C4-dicarboxylate transport response regulator DctD
MFEGLRVILVEDDPVVRHATAQILGLADIAVELHATAESALKSLTECFPGILLVDYQLPGMNGIALLERAMAIDQTLPVIVLTGHGDISIAVKAMRAGAYDFIEKSVSNDFLIGVIMRAMEKRRLTFEISDLRKKLEQRSGIESILIGGSESMVALRRSILALSDVTPDVLIQGETGSGKELVARALHKCSPSRDGQFVAINCGAIPETMFESELFGHEKGAFTGAHSQRIGKIEHASGGTLFLDEVEAMPLALQVKLLRVLQSRQVERLGSNRVIDVPIRVIAATKVDLKAASDAGRFRSDFYFRFSVVTLAIPPLRNRRDDILQLFEHHVLLAATRYKRQEPVVTDQLLRDLVSYDWPGNVRELSNVADRFVLGLLPGRFNGSASFNVSGSQEIVDKPLKDVVADFERSLIMETLRRNHGDVAVVGEILGMPKQTLYDKMRRYALSGDEFR